MSTEMGGLLPTLPPPPPRPPRASHHGPIGVRELSQVGAQQADLHWLKALVVAHRLLPTLTTISGRTSNDPHVLLYHLRLLVGGTCFGLTQPRWPTAGFLQRSLLLRRAIPIVCAVGEMPFQRVIEVRAKVGDLAEGLLLLLI